MSILELETFLKGTDHDVFMSWLLKNRARNFKRFDGNRNATLGEPELMEVPDTPPPCPIPPRNATLGEPELLEVVRVRVRVLIPIRIRTRLRIRGRGGETLMSHACGRVVVCEWAWQALLLFTDNKDVLNDSEGVSRRRHGLAKGGE